MTRTSTGKEVPVFSYDVDIVGLRFRMKRDFRKVLAGRLPIKVSFQREQMNKYDINAIRVDAAQQKLPVEKGEHLGYIRKETAALLAGLMDCRQDGGFVFKSAVLTELYEDDDFNSGNMHVEFHDYRSITPTV